MLPGILRRGTYYQTFLRHASESIATLLTFSAASTTMDGSTREQLETILKERLDNDLSHDFGHACRVAGLAERIAKDEGADLDVVIPAALFHDSIVYKGTENYYREHEESARFARETLLAIQKYPKEKIEKVEYAISVCSYSKGIMPDTLETKVLQDADMLESTGAISIMRTFGSSMPMHMKSFYNLEDPFCEKREPDPMKYSLDLFYQRLMKVSTRMHTSSARKMAEHRDRFLYAFIEELKEELGEANNYLDNH